MALPIFITIAGIFGAIIILRINHWEKYRELSHCETACNSGVIWLYAAVIVGIVSIILALFQLTPTDANHVEGIPLGLFGTMTFMVLVEILSVLVSVISKSFSGRPTNKSWLSCLDKTPTQYGEPIRANLCGKIFIGFELVIITIIVIVSILLSSWCK